MLKIISVTPCAFRWRKTCSIKGRLTTGCIGFGRWMVNGRKRVPSPPTRMTAFTSDSLDARINLSASPGQKNRVVVTYSPMHDLYHLHIKTGRGRERPHPCPASMNFPPRKTPYGY